MTTTPVVFKPRPGERQAVFIDRTLRGEYQSSPGNNPGMRQEIRTRLREIAEGLLQPKIAAQYLLTILAPGPGARRKRDCLTQEDFYVIGILCRRLREVEPVLAWIASFAEHDITRIMQSPAMLDRYRLNGHQLATPLF